jgi:hypothetical protein
MGALSDQQLSVKSPYTLTVRVWPNSPGGTLRNASVKDGSLSHD